MALNSFLYQNPLNVLIQFESRTCKGCKHKLTETVFGTSVTVCTFILKNGKTKEYKDKRCKHYEETT